MTPAVGGSKRQESSAVFGGGVSDVLASPRITPPPASLEEARSAPGRAERIEGWEPSAH